MALDRPLGKLLERIDVELLCLCSDHGFGGASIHAIYLNRFLEHHGSLLPKGCAGVWSKERWRFLGPHSNSAVNRLPHRLQGKVFRRFPRA